MREQFPKINLDDILNETQKVLIIEELELTDFESAIRDGLELSTSITIAKSLGETSLFMLGAQDSGRSLD